MKSSLNKSLASSSFASVFNTLVGAGIVSLPATLARTGVVLGSIVLAFVVVITCFAINFLLEVCVKRKAASPRSIAMAAYGWVGGFIADLSVYLFCVGSLIVYITLAGEYITNIITSRFNVPDWITTYHSAFIKGMVAIILIPFLLQKSVHNLRYTSYVVVLAAFFTSALLVYEVASKGIHESVVLFKFELPSVQAVGVIVFALSVNAAVPLLIHGVKQQVDDACLRKSTTVGASSAAICVAGLYFLSAISGYLVYGADVSDNVLNNIGSSSIPGLVANIAMALVVIFSFPIMCYPTRIAQIKLFTPKSDVDFMKAENFSYKKFLFSGYFLLAFSLVFAIVFPKVEAVLSIFGGICGSLCSLIIPLLCYMKISSDDSVLDPSLRSMKTWMREHLTVSIFCIVSIFIFIFFGTFSSVMSVIVVAKEGL